MSDQKMGKEKIYLSRTYRHLKVNKAESILFLTLLVLPCLIALLLGYGKVTQWVSELTAAALQQILPSLSTGFQQHIFIPGMAKIQTVTVPTTVPDVSFILVNIVITLGIIVTAMSGKRKTKPISIYLAIMLFIHLVNCVFFLFAGEAFPYSAMDYSELYMKQQVGIWICFLIIIGLVTGILGTGGLWLRIVTFAGVMLYSFVFGLLRYILFLYIIFRFSMLYMAVFFFALGPFFDFLYLVSIYGFYLNKLTDMYTSGKRKEEWIWS